MKYKTKRVLVLILAGITLAAGALAQPLPLTIDVSTRRDRHSIGSGPDGDARVENIRVSVTIHQRFGRPYPDPLNAELYVIGRQVHTGFFGIIDVVKQEFTLTQENNRTFEFTSPTYPLGRTSGRLNVGATYETYLVVIVDKDDNIIETRSGRAIREKGVNLIREMGPMTLFDRDGNVVGKVENPGEAFRRAVPAAVSGGSD